MTDFLFPPSPQVAVPIDGMAQSYPVQRIFCVGRNYAEHAAEMGSEIPDAPFYFTKTPQHVSFSGCKVPYPLSTQNYHHEMELYFAIGAPVLRATADEARSAILAYGCALDMTRRDRQGEAKDKRRPWDVGKDLESGCILAALTRAEQIPDINDATITLSVNGAVRQTGLIRDMLHDCTAIIQDLSRFYHLKPGDIVLTGTPAGVGPVVPGDHVKGEITGLAPVELTLTDPE